MPDDVLLGREVVELEGEEDEPDDDPKNPRELDEEDVELAGGVIGNGNAAVCLNSPWGSPSRR